ncbi:MAG TPA: hypothetical protein VNU92_17215 [Edaphobacter sp.]|jgi:hypothetical protein|nr:hypothetical protein [Edaphobacter sp.]
MPAPRSTKGIFGDDTNPDKDADVIMAAAIVGYSDKRLSEKKNCAFAAEVERSALFFPTLSLPPKIVDYEAWIANEAGPKIKTFLSDAVLFQNQVKDIARLKAIADEEVAFTRGWILLENAIDRINLALGIDTQKDVPRVVVDASPNFGGAGVIWIVGGTGNLSLVNQNRYVNSPDRSYDCGQRINYIDSNNFAGYKGLGAYTGMSSRQEGASYIYSPFRGYPSEEAGQRWLPKDPGILGYAIKPGNDPDGKLKYVSTWGIIGSNAIADKTQHQYQMVYEDFSQKEREKTYQTFVVGYTHGMIQAIYDVRQSEINRREEKNELYSGVPYEIGLKARKDKDPSTTKMASCFYCTLFMEANEKPPSSIHLGTGESWAPAYFSGDQIKANLHINDEENFGKQDLQDAIRRCNREWEKLCLEVLNRGISLIDRSRAIEPDHSDSFEALKIYMSENQYSHLAGNLILDSATVHEKIVVRVVRTLKPPGERG